MDVFGSKTGYSDRLVTEWGPLLFIHSFHFLQHKKSKFPSKFPPFEAEKSRFPPSCFLFILFIFLQHKKSKFPSQFPPFEAEKSRFPPSCFLSSPAGSPPLPGSPTPNDNEREGEQRTSLFGNYISPLPIQHQPMPLALTNHSLPNQPLSL